MHSKRNLNSPNTDGLFAHFNKWYKQMRAAAASSRPKRDAYKGMPRCVNPQQDNFSAMAIISNFRRAHAHLSTSSAIATDATSRNSAHYSKTTQENPAGLRRHVVLRHDGRIFRFGASVTRQKKRRGPDDVVGKFRLSETACVRSCAARMRARIDCCRLTPVLGT